MKKMWCFFVAAMMSIFIAGNIAYPAEEKYLKVTRDNAEIYFSPSSSSELIGKASLGDVLRLVGEGEGWYGVYLFSGERRFIQKRDAQIVTYQLKVPEDIEVRRRIFRALYFSEGKAMSDADKIVPPSNVRKNIEYQRILDDRYKLEIFHEYKVQPPLYRLIIVEGAKNKWR